MQYQPNNRGGAIRAALTSITSVQTIPQVFIGGQLVGGATDARCVEDRQAPEAPRRPA